jgi:DNA polymerase V
MKESIQIVHPSILQSLLTIPFLGEVSAGFPSPASDFMEINIDLNRELIKRPSSTFFVRVNGHSMQNIGIFDRSLLVVDKSVAIRNNQIVVCCIDSEFTVKRISTGKEGCFLLPENNAFPPIKVTEENELIIWGIVTYVITEMNSK